MDKFIVYSEQLAKQTSLTSDIDKSTTDERTNHDGHTGSVRFHSRFQFRSTFQFDVLVLLPSVFLSDLLPSGIKNRTVCVSRIAMCPRCVHLIENYELAFLPWE
ncbi:hypothetical protein L2E82_11777 [Cichorium intybus]|uniref:Uncharacterized protein n=1 Tax=Cichorium intybus TaxID=13427 RepID=A0ACB9GEZ0_CICIN|nr:hypothetical protein L2E82_11777 [Cichorium intybus]